MMTNYITGYQTLFEEKALFDVFAMLWKKPVCFRIGMILRMPMKRMLFESGANRKDMNA